MKTREDITGRKFNMLTVLGFSHTKGKSHFWRCLCDCGEETIVARGELRLGGTKSCGCARKPIKDLVGQKFGRLLVIDAAEERTRAGGMRWKCLCDCGNTIIVSRGVLVNTNTTKSCGCYRKEHSKINGYNRRIDLSGQRFGRLVVLSPAEKKGRSSAWRCKCDCGNIAEIRISALTGGHTRSCGCLHKERTSKARFKHGQSGTPLYSKWAGMKDRCLNTLNKNYHNYGGRGIKVCGRWLGENGFVNFFNDMGIPPKGKPEIDRIDNNKNYEPGNCRWVDHMKQSRNKRPNIFISMLGNTLCLKDMCSLLDVIYKRVHRRYRKGWAMDCVLLIPHVENRKDQRHIAEFARNKKRLNSLKY